MDFNLTESSAYLGEYLDYDRMSPVEYKYFARMRELGLAYRSGRITNPPEIATLRNQYYAQYQDERKRQDELEAYNAAWVNCVKVTESLRVHISKENDPVKIAVLALQAIYVMTNDCMMQKKAERIENENQRP